MAVVALYFVDYLKGKKWRQLLILSLFLKKKSLPSPSPTHPHFPCGFPSPVTLLHHPTRSLLNLLRSLPSPAAGGDLNRSAADRAALHQEAPAQEE